MITLAVLDDTHVEAHVAGEDEETVRWLTGGVGTPERTREYFAWLADNATRGTGKRGYGVLLDGRLAGYVDFDPGAEDLPAPGDVNLAYAVHPWARRRGVAAAAVELVCDLLSRQGIGSRAVIRTEEGNEASERVARHCGFTRLTGPVHDHHGTGPAFTVWVRPLGS